MEFTRLASTVFNCKLLFHRPRWGKNVCERAVDDEAVGVVRFLWMRVQTCSHGRHSGAEAAPPKFVVPRKLFLKHIIKTNFPPPTCILQQTLKPGYGTVWASQWTKEAGCLVINSNAHARWSVTRKRRWAHVAINETLELGRDMWYDKLENRFFFCDQTDEQRRGRFLLVGDFRTSEQQLRPVTVKHLVWFKSCARAKK